MKRQLAITISATATVIAAAAPASGQVNTASIDSASAPKSSPTCGIPGSSALGSLLGYVSAIDGAVVGATPVGSLIQPLDDALIGPFSWNILAMLTCTDFEEYTLPGSAK